MAPGAIWRPKPGLSPKSSNFLPRIATAVKSSLLNRSINIAPYRVKRGAGNCYYLEDDTEIYDGSGGASVATMGKRDKRVERAMRRLQRLGLSYVPALAFDTKVTSDLADFMLKTTDNMMKKAVFYCSGSEASEAALKIVTQYHTKEKMLAEPNRTLFIAREQSYHGNTLGALDVSGHEARKALYEKILPRNMHTVPACNEYRKQFPGQTTEQYVQWHREQLVNKIEELESDKVAAFIMEPVVGAALGCVPSVPGYLKAMREVCDKYGILLIFDEIMCGMGRTGYLHAWQASWQDEGVVPDIQLVGKALAAGFQPISGMLVGHKVVEAFENGPSNGVFNHGHTFQNYPLAAAAALEVQLRIQDDKLLENVREKGALLEKKLRQRLESHRYVGNIRGPKEALFLGLEFVQDKDTKTPFLSRENIYMRIFDKGLISHNIHVYPGAGCADKANCAKGRSGDHIMICPAFNISYKEVDLIVDRVGRLIEDFFDEYDQEHATNM